MQNLFRLLMLIGLACPSNDLSSEEIPAHLQLNHHPACSVDRYGKDPIFGVPEAVRVGGPNLLFTSQYLPSNRSIAGDFASQADDVLRQIREDLSKHHEDVEVVKLNIFVTSILEPTAIREVLERNFPMNRKPAVSVVQTRLSKAGAVIAMDLVGVECVRFYSSVSFGIHAGGPISGCSAPITVIPCVPRVYISGQAVKGANLRDATHKTLLELQSTMKSLGGNINRVAQMKCFLSPMCDISQADQAIRQFFGKDFHVPCVFVERESVIPIEIELVASLTNDAPAEKNQQLNMPRESLEFITLPERNKSPEGIRIARANDPRTIFFTSLLAEDTGDGVDQVTQVFDRLDKLVIARASSLQDLAKVTYYVGDNETSTKLNEVLPNYFDPKRSPVATRAQVKRVGIRGHSFMLDVTAIPNR